MKIIAAVSREGQPHPLIEEVELEEPRADEVRVRLVATGICHTDLLCHAGLGVPTPRPIVLGHEGAGVVESVGAGGRGPQGGRRCGAERRVLRSVPELSCRTTDLLS